ncbi:HYC_CC_PP family protein [Flavobacterium sp.]|uniref:HYC_CC_PP family protein n=1 Tax=Flavobacterium sp. TaxID=239 RepID=UPI0038FCB9F6
MIIKKQLSVFLSIFILVSNLGLAFNVHYCNDAIASISLRSQFQYSSAEKNCCGSFKKKSSCCQDKVFHFQKKSENVSFDSLTFSPYFTFTVDNWNPFVFNENLIFKSEKTRPYYCDANAPPLFKLYHQFIFYA